MEHTHLNHGLSDNTVKTLTDIFKQFSNIHSVILYGSRAKGNYHKGSDIDFAIDAPNMNNSEFARLWNAVDELPLIYKIDCLHVQRLNNNALLDNIHKQGVVFYKAGS